MSDHQSNQQSVHSTLNPDSLYSSCLALLLEKPRLYPGPSSLEVCELLWSITVSVAHALEIASRVFSAQEISDPERVANRVAPLLLNQGLPTEDDLYDLWRTWSGQHLDWSDTDTVQVPLYFSICRANYIDDMCELHERFRRLPRPVYRAWMGLVAGPPQPAAVRLQRFLDTMDGTLGATVRRRLERTRDEDNDGTPSANTDAESVAFLGAVDREHRSRAWIVELLRREESITTDSGQSIEIPTIPQLPIRGMERADGLDAVWRAAAKESALKLLAAIAPGTRGLLEMALPDAAHAAQRAEHDRADAKKRGGTGGRKAKKAGTTEPAAQHIPIGNHDEDPGCIDLETLADIHPNPQQEAETQEVAGHALRIAIDRWGQSGQRMLEALKAGQTDKKAAKAAGISGPMLSKRLKTLKKLLDH